MPSINYTFAPINHVCEAERGQAVTDFLPGDFILVHGNNWYSKLIRFGQSLRLDKENKDYAYWTHTALIISKDGYMIEATGKGVKQTKLSCYTNYIYKHIGIDATDADRLEAVSFASRCLEEKYGWLTIVSIAFSLLTGSKLSIGLDGQEICSGLVSRSLERTTAVFPYDPSHISPALLAMYYKAKHYTTAL